MGELAPAIKELEEVHRENPGDDQSAMVLADCYVQSGRDTEAIALLSPLEPVQPDDPDLEWLLGSALIQAGRAQEGVGRVENAAGKDDSADAWLLAGQTRLELTQFDLAKRDADAALALNPNLAGLETLRGMIQEQTADYDGAEATLLQALAANPNDYNAHYYLGAIYYFKRNMDSAREHLARALELQPSSSDKWMRRCEIWSSLSTTPRRGFSRTWSFQHCTIGFTVLKMARNRKRSWTG
jgi:tetratricopeptide (TPR) repeat protein